MSADAISGEIRKLRKKLRQIEHLERLERDLTAEECEKISKKSAIRELLQQRLEQIEASNVERVTEKMSEKLVVKEDDRLAGSKSKPQKRVPVEEGNVLNDKVSQLKQNTNNGECAGSVLNKNTSSERSKSTFVESTKTSLREPTAITPESSAASVSFQSMQEAKMTKSECLGWQGKKFKVFCLEGHNDIISSVDMDGTVLISGSRDTMLKVWNADTMEEVRSMGGHTGGITSVVLVKKDENGDENGAQYLGVTGSHDCSMKIWSLKDGKATRSIYAYSPVLCLDFRGGNLVSGSDGGKVELWDLEAGESICSTRSTDDVPVTCVKFKDDCIVSGSSLGTVKVWDVRQRSLAPALSSQDLSSSFLKRRRIHCLATTENTVYWGDEGTNIKALDIRAGKVRKLKNHLTEFGSTNAMIIKDSLLISSGFNLDKGTGYLNVRTLPDEQYLATVDDEITGYISSLSCANVQKDAASCQRLCTGGHELKIWDQMAVSKVRKRTRSDGESSSFVTSKHIKRYGSSEQIDTESSDESDGENRDESSNDDDEDEGTTTTARQSWCTVS